MIRTTKEILFIAILALSVNAFGFAYDSKDLAVDLKNATDVVIAKKVSGRIAYGPLTEEIDRYQKSPINWRTSSAWKRLQKRNQVESAFLVMNSIKGAYKVGDELRFQDDWIPVELRAVKLYFLN